MTPAESKLDKLVALAVSTATPMEEARTAAYQACLLITAHKLRLNGVDSSSDKEFWSRIAENIVTATDCKDTETVSRWADKILAARKERFG